MAGQALPIDFNAMREKRVASELERLAAAQRVHDRIQARLREARRREFERAAGVPLEDVRPVLGA